MRRIVVLLLFVLNGCSDNNLPPIQNKLDIIVDAYMEENDYVGLAIGAVKNDEVVFDRAYGFSDKNNNQAFSSETLISLGSNTKTLTAAAILQLQKKGLLNISDSLDKHLPFPLNHSHMITLHEMLCHSSDLADVFGVGKFENYVWQQAKSQKEFIDKLNTDSDEPLAGKSYRYNNTAYFLLGLVVEHISNQSLGDFFRENIFQHMPKENLYYLGDSYYSPTLSPSFEKDGFKVGLYESPVEYRIVGGAGALAGDLISYLRMFKYVMSGQVLDSDSRALMLSLCKFKDGSDVVNGKQQNIALGIEVLEINGETVYSRGGALNGYVSSVYYFPTKNLTIGITGNTGVPLAPLLEKLFEAGWQNEI